MGVVFLARDTTLHRHVALKVLASPAAGETAHVQLLREARNAAALNHPNICTVYEVSTANGSAFIAMEYVEGRSLRDRLDEGALPLDEAVRYGLEAADALAYAHEHGVVHRDFKAANAMITGDGRLKIVDFGLARRGDALVAGATTMASLPTRFTAVDSALVHLGNLLYNRAQVVTLAQIRDVDIRRSLHAEMRRRHDAEADTLILDELGLCQGVARVDLAVVNGSLHGYEIKSECDTLQRLPSQREVYSRALDYVTIVTSAKHAKKVRRSVPRWWGIWAANPSTVGIELSEVRAPRANPDLDARAVAELLWRNEALEELESRGLAGGLRGKPRRELWAKLADSIPPADLCAVVRERLKGRQRWRVLARPT